MGDASRLVEAMKRAAKPKENEIVDIVVGTVTSIKPLKIKIDKLELTESFLILSALCKEAKIKIPSSATLIHTHTIPVATTESSGEDSHSHSVPQSTTGESKGYFPDIVLWRGLKVGDDVYMIRCSQGQKYYVLQRKEGVV